MAKVEIKSDLARRLLAPYLVTLVTSEGKDRKPNIIPLGWTMPTSFSPLLVAVSVGTARYSHRLIEEGGEFVLNLPPRGLVEKVNFCGSCSGDSVDKFKEADLTPLPSERVKPPRISECFAHIECKLVDKFRTGDHTIFVGEVVAGSVDEGVFDEGLGILDLASAELLCHVGGKYFVTAGERFEAE